MSRVMVIGVALLAWAAAAPVASGSILYDSTATSFSDWETNRPDVFYWDGAHQAYHYAITDGDSDYAFVTVPYQSGQSFRLQFDVLPTSTDWAGNFRFGMWDSSMREEGASNIRAMYHLDDNGHHVICSGYYVGGSGAWTPGTHADYADGEWYHNEIVYDAQAGKLAFAYTRASDGLTLAGTAAGLGQFADLDRLAMTSIGDSGYPGRTATGFVRNVKLESPAESVSAVPEPSSLLLLLAGVPYALGTMRRGRRAVPRTSSAPE